MSLTAKQGPPPDQIEEGNHQGVCVAVIDLGTQYSEKFKKEQAKVVIVWEFPDFPLPNNDGYKVLTKEYTASLGEKTTLYTDLIAWRGRAFTPEELDGFNLKAILGANCLVNVIKNERGYATPTTVAKLPKGLGLKMPSYQLLYDMDEDKTIPTGIEDTPRFAWIAAKIKKSREYLGLVNPPESDDEQSLPATDEDIPF